MVAERFGRYTLLEPLGRGGMAEVFLAQSAQGRRVALKRIRFDHRAREDYLRLFLREGKISLALSHANVAQVFDFGEVDGTYFLAMEYVEGVSAAELVAAFSTRGERVPLQVAAFVTLGLLRGLAHAHGLTDEAGRCVGLVHRDVSPHNVMLSTAGEVKVVDFGVAKEQRSETLTAPGVARGKLPYLPPEVVRGQAADARSDLYQAGVTLFELVTGRPPFTGDLQAVLDAIVTRPAPSLRRLAPDADAALEAIVTRALAKHPEQRFGSAREMETALAEWLHRREPGFDAGALAEIVRRIRSDEGDLLPPAWRRWRRPTTPAPEAEAQASRRRRLWPILAGALGAALLLAVALGLWLRPPAPPPKTRVTSVPSPAQITLPDGRTLSTPALVPVPERGFVRVTVSAPGYRPQQRLLGAGPPVHVVLEAQPPPPLPATAQEEEDAPPPMGRFLSPAEARWPPEGARGADAAAGRGDRDLRIAHLDLSRHLVPVASLPHVSLELDPSRAWILCSEGALVFEPSAGLQEDVVAVLAQTPAGERLHLLSPRTPVRIGAATHIDLFAFVEGARDDDRGTIRLAALPEGRPQQVRHAQIEAADAVRTDTLPATLLVPGLETLTSYLGRVEAGPPLLWIASEGSAASTNALRTGSGQVEAYHLAGLLEREPTYVPWNAQRRDLYLFRPTRQPPTEGAPAATVVFARYTQATNATHLILNTARSVTGLGADRHTKRADLRPDRRRLLRICRQALRRR